MCAQRSAPSEAVVIHATVCPSPTGIPFVVCVDGVCVKMYERARAAACSRLDGVAASTEDVQFPFRYL